jgi:hypothetical protein
MENIVLNNFLRILVCGLLISIFPAESEATIWSCTVPETCPERNGESKEGPTASHATFRFDSDIRSAELQRYLNRTHLPMPARGAIQGDSLFGDMSGDWDRVTGFVTFPHSFDGIDDDYLLIRGLPAERLPDSDTYQVNGWTRSAYWIDVGNGLPRLLSSELLEPNYIPEPDDPFEDSGELNVTHLVRYREQGRDYDQEGFPGGAAFGSLFFLVNPADGEVIDAVIALFDANNEYEKVEYLYEGDELQPLLISYKLDEPEYLYYAEYGEFIVLSQSVEIGLANHVPGVDFVDPDLDKLEFEAATVPLVLLLEGFAEPEEPEGDPTWAYSTPSPLGYTWGQSAARIFGSRFEPEDAGRAANSRRQVVRSRQQ